jgi:hypothetical protein
MTILDPISGPSSPLIHRADRAAEVSQRLEDSDETILSTPGDYVSAKLPKVVSANIFSLDEYGDCQ